MSAQRRAALYFLVQFLSSGAFHAYGGIWFASLGFSANQIAALSSFPIFVVLLINIFVGRIADRARDWRYVLVIGALASFLFSCGLLLSTRYSVIFIFWSLALIAQSIIVPVADGAALFLTQQGRGEIGTLRGLSTVGYIIGLIATGYIMQSHGGAIFAAMFAAFSGARALAAYTMPEFKTPLEQAKPVTRINLAAQLRAPWLVLPLLGWSIIYATIQVLNSFLALIFQQAGYSEWTISLLIATGAIAEALVFFLFRRFSHYFDLRTLILVSCLVTVFRWVVMATEPSLPVHVMLQSLHGITYAMGFLACVSHIGRNTPQGNEAEAQSLFMTMQLIAAIAVITIFGSLMETYGAKAFWGSAAIALFGAGVVLAGMRFNPPAPIAPGQSALPPSPT
jgi:MFS transporter, PPP family, 3-phenylpropionic acid transporter